MEGMEKIREGLYLKKGLFGYRLVYPVKNEDGTINLFNLLTGGSWGNLIKILLIIAFILILSLSYYHDIKECRKVMANPCNYCAIQTYPPISQNLQTENENSIFIPVSPS